MQGLTTLDSLVLIVYLTLVVGLGLSFFKGSRKYGRLFSGRTKDALDRSGYLDICHSV